MFYSATPLDGPLSGFKNGIINQIVTVPFKTGSTWPFYFRWSTKKKMGGGV
jgi:hypothetical protein